MKIFNHKMMLLKCVYILQLDEILFAQRSKEAHPSDCGRLAFDLLVVVRVQLQLAHDCDLEHLSIYRLVVKSCDHLFHKNKAKILHRFNALRFSDFNIARLVVSFF